MLSSEQDMLTTEFYNGALDFVTYVGTQVYHWKVCIKRWRVLTVWPMHVRERILYIRNRRRDSLWRKWTIWKIAPTRNRPLPIGKRHAIRSRASLKQMIERIPERCLKISINGNLTTMRTNVTYATNVEKSNDKKYNVNSLQDPCERTKLQESLSSYIVEHPSADANVDQQWELLYLPPIQHVGRQSAPPHVGTRTGLVKLMYRFKTSLIAREESFASWKMTLL